MSERPLRIEDAEFGEEELLTCESCGYPARELLNYQGQDCGTDDMRKDRIFCILCSQTKAGNAVVFPRQYEDTAVLLQHACFLANVILDALGRGL